MAIEVRGINKSFGSKEVLSNVSFTVKHGELVTLLGSNGAGKSTLFSIVSGLRMSGSGTVTIDGHNPRSIEARKLFRLSPQDCDFPKTVRGKEIFNYVSSLSPAPWKDQVVQEFNLATFWNLQTGAMSGGQKRRLSLAMAFSSQPRYILFDEPSAGLDLEARQSLWSFLKSYCRQGGSCLLTTHYLEEAEYLSDKIHILKSGKTVFEGPVETLKKSTRNLKLIFRAREVINFSGAVCSGPGMWTVLTRDSDVEIRNLVNSGTEFHDLRVESASLEESFLGLTKE